MHPKEAKVAIGTGRMVHREVLASHLLVGERFEDAPALTRLLIDPNYFPVVLFPAVGAFDLTTATAESARRFFPASRRPLVLALDGTWSTAKKLLRLSPRLTALPAIRFTPPTASRYGRLRREPRPGCWSTLESVHQVIVRLDALGIAPAPKARAHDHLLELMDGAVRRQLAFEPARDLPASRGGRPQTPDSALPRAGIDSAVTEARAGEALD